MHGFAKYTCKCKIKKCKIFFFSGLNIRQTAYNYLFLQNKKPIKKPTARLTIICPHCKLATCDPLCPVNHALPPSNKNAIMITINVIKYRDLFLDLRLNRFIFLHLLIKFYLRKSTVHDMKENYLKGV